MSIRVECPKCGATLDAKDDMAGRRGKCPKCGGVLEVPDAGAGAAAEGEDFFNPKLDLSQRSPVGSPSDSGSDTVGGQSTVDMIYPEDVNVQELKRIFDAAFIAAEIDSDGDLVLKGRWRTFVEFPDSGRFIRFFSMFRAKDEHDMAPRIAYANRVNVKFNFIRVYSREWGMIFDTYVWVDGGVSKKGLVTAYNFFASLLDDSLAMGAEDVLA